MIITVCIFRFLFCELYKVNKIILFVFSSTGPHFLFPLFSLLQQLFFYFFYKFSEIRFLKLYIFICCPFHLILLSNGKPFYLFNVSSQRHFILLYLSFSESFWRELNSQWDRRNPRAILLLRLFGEQISFALAYPVANTLKSVPAVEDRFFKCLNSMFV